ncbi:hypothetical protein BGW41_001575 [Actinomortierella wolfii]|nr:hypothetical protein BGW41_001575 [Actinomortierella wolfii]
METLGAFFPGVPLVVLQEALDQNSGNVDAAASYVLDWKEEQPITIDDSDLTPIRTSPLSSQSSSKAKVTVIDLTEDQDEWSPPRSASSSSSSSSSNPFVTKPSGANQCSHVAATNGPSLAGSSQQSQKPSFEDSMAEQERSIQLEIEKRQSELAEREKMKENFIEMVQAQFPDISTKFVRKLMDQKRLQTASDEAMLDLCMEDLLKLNGRYPTVKRKHVDDEEGEDDDDNEESQANHGHNDDESDESSSEESDLELMMQSQDADDGRDIHDTTIRMKPEYEFCSATQIFRDFPHLAHKPIREALAKHNYHYVPTYYYLDSLWMGIIDQPVTKQRGIVLKVPRKKGKFTAKKDPAFRRERKWLKQKIAKELAEIDKAEREAENLRECIARGELMTCGCCYDDEIPINRVTTCGDGHMFCLECGRKAAENVIGMGRTELKCLSPDCTSIFSDAEAKRFLSKTVFSRLMRIRQQKELEKAGIDSLVECPFCPYAAIVEDENDKEFRCQAPKCRAVSCRLCKAITHIPLTCEEYAKQREEDSVLAAQHRAEEEMSKALIRECTKCKTRFFKEEGCNKMTCPTCMTVTCYSCKREIRNGYAHFDPTPANSPPAKPHRTLIMSPMGRYIGTS